MNPLVKQMLIVLGLIGVSIGGVAILSQFSNSSTASILDALANETVPAERTKGPSNAPVTLVEYSDFQCPACAAYEPMVGQILQEFGDKIRFTYRHFPLKQIHANAVQAALAAEAAGMQGKFWEMHDILFKEQLVWKNESGDDLRGLFTGYAAEIGLDVGRFMTDIESDAAKNSVESDADAAFRGGLQGTPTFFVNGKSINNPASYDEFRQIIQSAIDSR